MERVSPEIGQVAITVSDVASVLPLYRDTLGVELLFSPGPGLAFLAAGPVRIMLSTPQGAMVAMGAMEERAPQLAAKLPDHELWIGFLRDPDGNPVGLMEERR